MLLEQIEQDITQAMKQKQETVVSTLRMLKSALKNKEIQIKKELNSDDIVQVVQAQIKTRKDSVQMYLKGGRQELAQKEEQEIEILKKYLPEQISSEDIKQKVEAAIHETGAKTIQDMGKVMGKISAELKGQADMAEVSKIVKEKLNEN